MVEKLKDTPDFIDTKLASTETRKIVARVLHKMVVRAQEDFTDDIDPDDLCQERIVLSRIGQFCVEAELLTQGEVNLIIDGKK
jgi:DNA replication initiation complex subunit (GINS family)